MFESLGLVISVSKIAMLTKQSQLIGMDSVTDIFKYHLLCFATIIEVKVISGHQEKKSFTAPVAAIPVNPYFRSKSEEHDVTLTSFIDELWNHGL